MTTLNSTYLFRTKAQTLEYLADKVKAGSVKTLEYFTVAQWRTQQGDVLDRIQRRLDDDLLIVRSSAAVEDSHEASHAGCFISVAHVPRTDRQAMAEAVEKVIASYGQQGTDEENEVLIQGQISTLSMIGVACTCDLSILSPYYVINYQDEHCSFDSVTSGRSAGLKTYVAFKRSAKTAPDERIVRVIHLLKELEALLGSDKLDVEFAFDEKDGLYLLQVRPIVQRDKAPLIDEHALEECLAKIQKKVAKLNGPHPYLYGHRTILGVMPDWNPAEILGSKPRMLAISLYRELVTDAIWAYQRSNYGYKSMRSFPLLRNLMGQAYIDVRVSFNSFLPGGLREDLAHKLVDYYIERLSQYPQNHDKVEFEIVFSCYYLNLHERIAVLKQHGFSEEEIREIRENLLQLTNAILNPQDGFYHDDLKRIETLRERQRKILNSDLPIIDKIYWLVEDCKRYGTLPFAGLARCAFIARQFMKSLVELRIISEEDLQAFMGSLDTVTKRLTQDLHQLKTGKMAQEQFLERYGHLRPGTYDIMSLRYDEGFDQYFSSVFNEPDAVRFLHKEFHFTEGQMKAIDQVLQADGLCVNARQLLDFVRQVTVGREYAKFVFTKSLSDVLVLLEQFGLQFGATRDDMSFLNIRTVLDLYAVLDNEDLPEILRDNITRNRQAYRLSSAIKFPPLIMAEDDIHGFFIGDAEPNFVSLKRVTGLTAGEPDLFDIELKDRIVLIPSADPGYDWLFSRGIAALITMYGGANSHMAVRAAELGIPAVIGAGERFYRAWEQATLLDVDCANKQVTVIR